MDITGADYARDIPLTDHNGQARHLKDFAGKVVVVFFGFTQCPDVCPTSMAELAQARRLTAESTQEQASAGLDALTDAELRHGSLADAAPHTRLR